MIGRLSREIKSSSYHNEAHKQNLISLAFVFSLIETEPPSSATVVDDYLQLPRCPIKSGDVEWVGRGEGPRPGAR